MHYRAAAALHMLHSCIIMQISQFPKFKYFRIDALSFHWSYSLGCWADLMYLLQPGVANVYCAVTQHSRNGATFYLEHFPMMTGKSYRWVTLFTIAPPRPTTPAFVLPACLTLLVQ